MFAALDRFPVATFQAGSRVEDESIRGISNNWAVLTMAPQGVDVKISMICVP